MNRLTSDKPVSEMGMVELAHNSCYIKDGKARYRDYSMDEDARTLARALLKEHTDSDDTLTCDEDFDEWMVEYLQEGFDSIEGLIALLYRHMWTMADLRERLKAYEDTGLSPEQIREVAKLNICEPEYLGENMAIGCRNGRCRCGNIVRSYHNFCNECGIKLEWGNVHG